MDESDQEQQQPLIIDPFLWGKKDPMWDLDKEQPWHRIAAWAFSQGATCRDVAEGLGKSEPAVQNLLRHRGFQQKVTAMMAEAGRKGPEGVLKRIGEEQYDSLTTLVEMRDNPRVPASVRVLCARDILDRGLGKPVQRVETTNTVTSDDPVAEVERLEQEIEHLRQARY